MRETSDPLSTHALDWLGETLAAGCSKLLDRDTNHTIAPCTMIVILAGACEKRSRLEIQSSCLWGKGTSSCSTRQMAGTSTKLDVRRSVVLNILHIRGVD